MKNTKNIENIKQTRTQLCLLNNKGAVTLFVLITCIFMLIVVMLANVEIINRKTSQQKELEKIEKEYNVTSDELSEKYNDNSYGNPHITVKIEITSKPANGELYSSGETITYEITVKNDGNSTITDITVTDELTGDKWTIESLAVGESKTFTAKYVVTDEDMTAESVVNEATAKGTSADSKEGVSNSYKIETPLVIKTGHLTITKTTTSTPENGEAYYLGETITYEITAENDGNLTLTDITVTDELTGDEWPIESLAPGASESFDAAYTVTEKDILAGEVVNVVTATGTTPDSDTPVTVDPGKETVPVDPKDGHLTITKTTTSTPANGETYALGEVITYAIAATNDGNLTLTDITVTDESTGDEWPIESLEPGASETFTAAYEVTQADLLAGEVLNVATASGISPDPDVPDVPVEPGEEKNPTDPKNGHLTIWKTTTSTPANGEDYVYGETITYEITAQNDGNITLTDVVVTDELTGDEWPIESLEPGASKTFTAEYVVTEADILAGSVLNVATATGTSPDPEEPDVPVEPGEKEDPVEPKDGHLTITCEATSEPAKGELYELGETITYEITAMNDGNLTLTDITVTDELTGDKWTIESLAPYESKTFTVEHVVTQEDILAGSILNVATATGVNADLDEPDVPVDPGEEEVPVGKNILKKAHITVKNETTSEPENGEAYEQGETITYKITATNDGQVTLANIILIDDLTGDEWTDISLAPGESKIVTAEHIVTERDILAGSIVNEATATGESSDPDESEATVKPGIKEDPVKSENSYLKISRAVTNKPANGESYELGETIKYGITARNDGQVTLTDITITDESNGREWIVESLKPGESKTLTSEYVVTEADILAGKVVNVATATGESPDPDKPGIMVDSEETSISVGKQNKNILNSTIVKILGVVIVICAGTGLIIYYKKKKKIVKK